MPTAEAISHSEFDDAPPAPSESSRHYESRSDGWPDWPNDADEPAVIEDAVRQNAPAIVFGDIVRLLAMTFAVITVVELSLKALLH